ncbi:MAG TPA: malto-oligosyltrehalose trehalohydrolase [Myxococcaceae bacterium]|nr:malto-oligosyltrehalose trehalohydrolase [Myxococcaceae bacterium]
MSFRYWAPERSSLTIVTEEGRRLSLTREGPFFTGLLSDAGPGLRYRLSVNGGAPIPDPLSRSQPQGIDGPSEVWNPWHPWTDAAWCGLPEQGQVFYEVHIGTATDAGTFDALIPRLPELKELGVTALELMPVATFPGTRNWGYDGVFPFAPQASYGGPDGLRRLVDAAHAVGLGVVLDVVFNHLGPEGNRLPELTAHTHARRTTPWGAALDFDGPAAPFMRSWVRDAVEHWIGGYHLDGLRLDATHAIHDQSEPHLLEELRERAQAAAGRRPVLLIAEDGLNREHLTRGTADGGYGLSMQWSDDFHHVAHRMVTGESRGYYRDFVGSAEELAHALRRGWVYEGAPSLHYGGPRGTDASEQPPHRFVFFLQNHDQIGNRPFGDRLHELVSPATFRALTALLLLAPQTPLLFMGQEWGATSPFGYFTEHSEQLGRAVRSGRRREAEHFAGQPLRGLPDPQDIETFERSRLRWEEASQPRHRALRELHRELLHLRHTHPALRGASPGAHRVRPLGPSSLELVREGAHGARVRVVLHLGGVLDHRAPEGGAPWLSTEAPRFGGEGFEPQPVDGVLRLEEPVALLWKT